MAEERDDFVGAGISPGQRLSRIESMLADLSRQLDVRFLSVEHRVQVLETANAVAESLLAQQKGIETEFHQRMEREVEEAKALMAEEVEALKKGQLDVGRLVKYATAVIVAAGLAADAVMRFVR